MNLIMSDTPLLLNGLETAETHYVDLSRLKIANCVGCFGWQKTILFIESNLPGERVHQAKTRIDGCVIQFLIGAEKNFSEVHGCNTESSAYGDKQ